MAFNISDFKSNLQFGGARNTLFSVQLSPPPGVAGLDFRKAPFLVKSAAIPESTLDPMPVSYFGRTIKMAGDRTFADWTVTVINDEDFAIRNALESWSNSINQMRGNRRLSGSSPTSYKANATVTQYGKSGNVLRTYKFEGLFPSRIAAIDLNWERTNQIEDFQVQFEYDHWVLEAQGTSSFGIGNQG